MRRAGTRCVRHSLGTAARCVGFLLGVLVVGCRVPVLVALFHATTLSASWSSAWADSEEPTGVLVVEGTSEPSEGVATIKLLELWRARLEDSSTTRRGQIVQVQEGASGSVFCLVRDRGVVVYSSDGEHLMTHSPSTRPRLEVYPWSCFILLDDESLLLCQWGNPFPIVVSREGSARRHRAFYVPACEWGAMEVREGQWRNNRLVGTAYYQAAAPPPSMVQRSLTVLSRFAPEEGGEEVRYVSQEREWDPTRCRHREEEQYFPSGGRWALGDDGRVHVAPLRDAYEIHTYAPDGRLERILRRDLEVPGRSPERLAMLREALKDLGARRGGFELSETDPAITELRVDEGGLLWVLHAGSAGGQPPGIMLTYDVFDPRGQLVKKVAVECDGDGEGDVLYFLDDKHVVRVPGARDSGVVVRGGGVWHGDQREPAQIVFYQISEEY